MKHNIRIALVACAISIGGAFVLVAEDSAAIQPSPTLNSAPPKDAVVLFDGSNLDAWSKQKTKEWETADGPAAWKIVPEKVLEVVPGANSIITKKKFGNCQLHLEFRLLEPKTNGGVFLLSRYELDINDSYGRTTGPQCGTFDNLSQPIKPTVAATLPNEQWQTFDVDFRAPRLDKDGKVLEKARATVQLNGKTIHDNVELGRTQRRRQTTGRCCDRCADVAGTWYGTSIPEYLAGRKKSITPVMPPDSRTLKANVPFELYSTLLRTYSCAALVCLILFSTACAGDFDTERLDNWHQWRGPNANGYAPNGDPPLNWDESTNIQWKVEIPGSGSSTPIVWGDRVFVLTAIDTGRTPDPSTLAAAREPPPIVATAPWRKERRRRQRSALDCYANDAVSIRHFVLRSEFRRPFVAKNRHRGSAA